MKNSLLCLSLLICFAACKKDTHACKTYKDLAGSDKTLDPGPLNAPELRDTLKKYPQLQLYEFNAYTLGWTAHCRVFYQGLLVFSDTYTLSKTEVNPSIFTPDTLLNGILGLSLSPGIGHESAIREARKHINFDHTCISYRLGLYNVNAGMSLKFADYKLVWKIQGESQFPYIILDANNYRIYQLISGNWID